MEKAIPGVNENLFLLINCSANIVVINLFLSPKLLLLSHVFDKSIPIPVIPMSENIEILF